MSENPTTKNETSEEWAMPEPVFRSSGGVSPLRSAENALLELGPEDDIPTEMMGFVENEGMRAEAFKQSVRVKEQGRRRHHKKKRTQSKLMRGLALLIGLLIGSIILAVIYFLFR